MNLAAERILLLQRDAEWAAAASEGRDLERVLSYWTDDAIVVPPGLPAVVGKAALREYVQASMSMPGFRINWASTEVTFSPDTNFAYMFGTNWIDMNDPAGTPLRTYGRAVTIWRKDSDGEWRCAVDIWNAPPPTEPSPVGTRDSDDEG
jgi:ketosteroid isomerase-like protein